MKINLNPLPRLALMTGSSPQKILINTKIKTVEGTVQAGKHELREDKLYELDK